MTTIILDGKTTAAKWIAEIKEGVTVFENKYHRSIKLLIVQIGAHPASNLYIKNKKRQAQLCNIVVEHKIFDSTTITTKILCDWLREQQVNKTCDGILIQLPLPSHLDEQQILEQIDGSFDVDGFGPQTVAKMWMQKNFNPLQEVLACTPKGIIKLLDAYNIRVAGKKVLIINRSNIVGKPLAAMMLALNATVTLAHSRSTNLKQLCLDADLIVTGVGSVNFLDESYVQAHTVVIDVAINWDQNHQMVGDIQKNSLIGHCQAFSPVPGGVGPMTVATIFANLVLLAYQHEKNQ